MNPARRRRRPPIRVAVAIVLLVCALPALASAARCTVTLKADGNTAAVQRAMDAKGPRRPVVCLRPGVYKGARLIASRSCTLKGVGKGKVILDAGARGRILTVTDKGLDVRLEGLVLSNGDIEDGGAVAQLADSRLHLADCWLTANRAARKGGGIYANAGQLALERTRISSNYGASGGALLLEGTARMTATHSMISDNRNEAGSNGPIWLAGASRLDLRHSTLAYNVGHGVYLRPTPRGPAPHLHVDSAVIMGAPDAIFVARSKVSQVAVFRSVLHGGIGFIALDLASKRAIPRFNLVDQERYRPTKGSPAIALGLCKGKGGKRDLARRLRPKTCTAGALEALPGDVKDTLAEWKKAEADKKRNGHDQPW